MLLILCLNKDNIYLFIITGQILTDIWRYLYKSLFLKERKNVRMVNIHHSHFENKCDSPQHDYVHKKKPVTSDEK